MREDEEVDRLLTSRQSTVKYWTMEIPQKSCSHLDPVYGEEQKGIVGVEGKNNVI